VISGEYLPELSQLDFNPPEDVDQENKGDRTGGIAVVDCGMRRGGKNTEIAAYGRNIAG